MVREKKEKRLGFGVRQRAHRMGNTSPRFQPMICENGFYSFRKMRGRGGDKKGKRSKERLTHLTKGKM